MKKEDLIYLKHILEEITKIEKSTSNITKKEFDRSADIQDATLRRLEIIGEASKNISSELKKENNKVEWKKMAGTRDILIHSYFSVDMDLIWDVLRKDLPLLKERLEKIIKAD